MARTNDTVGDRRTITYAKDAKIQDKHFQCILEDFVWVEHELVYNFFVSKYMEMIKNGSFQKRSKNSEYKLYPN